MTASPDPEKAFVAFLRAQFGGVTVGTTLTAARPSIVVDLIGGFAEIVGVIDRVRIDLTCYDDDPRTLAAQVRTALGVGFTAAGQRVMRVAADPPQPEVDAQTFEGLFRIPLSASIHATS